MSQTHQLKTPFFVYALGISFIFAPIGNIMTSLYSSGYGHMMSLPLFLKAVQVTPAIDLAWMMMLIISGIALFIKHKLTWSFAILTLVLITLLNFYKITFQISQSDMSHSHHVINIFTTLAVLVIVYYFRFPYLDRRMTWNGFAPRYNVNVPAQIKGVDATILSLSSTGARLNLKESIDDISAESTLIIQFSGLDYLCEVVDWANPTLRLKFIQLDKNQKENIERIVIDSKP